jgi:hypothetical protein
MSVDYEQLKTFVKEAMFTGGGINEPSAPEGVPHRMPAADADTPEQERGEPKANKLFAMAVAAREGVEELIEGLDEPIFDGAYEHAFKASACLRRCLNSLQESGAHPMPTQHVVAPPVAQQKYNAGGGDYSGGAAGVGFAGLAEIATGLESERVTSLMEEFGRLSVEEQKEFISLLPTPEEGVP